nr:MAG TPA: hypothetical protein [Bacteriophage sp.]
MYSKLSFKTHHEPLRIVGDELNRIRSTVLRAKRRIFRSS